MTVLPVRARAPAPPAPPARPDPAAGSCSDATAAAGQWAALAGAVAGGGWLSGRVRVSRDGGRSYPRSRERALTATVPDQPAAVRIYDDHGDARCLVADLDVARAGQHQVDLDVARLLALLGRCGGGAFTDTSPSGGRHVYLPLAQPVGHDQLRPVLYALATLLPSLDIAPGVNLLAGCVRPPGARHKTGGWQRLDGPLGAARALTDQPNSPQVWTALTDALRPQLTAQLPLPTDPTLTMPADAAGGAGPKERRAAVAPPVRTGGPRPLRPAALQTARTGSYDSARYRSPSEARQSVLAAAAGSGWSWQDLTGQLHAGAWPGLWSFYTRYTDRHRREALAGDWLTALRYAHKQPPANDQESGHVHNPDTREPPTHRPWAGPSPNVMARAGGALPADGYQFLRAWWTAVRLAERDRYAGRAGQSRRLVLRALGAAGQKTGRHYLAFGVRSLAIATGLSRTTVALALRALREEDDPLVSLLVGGRGLAGDLYELWIPAGYAEQARTDPWRPGRIEALLPCFRILGVPAAFVYEALDSQPQSSWDLAASALLSPRAAQHALAELAAHGLAARQVQGWVRGPADPTAVSRSVGADLLVREQVGRYRAERTSWQRRLGAHPAVSIQDFLDGGDPTAPETEAAGRDWLVTQPNPPPDTPTAGAEHDALQLVLRLLGGVVLEPSAR